MIKARMTRIIAWLGGGGTIVMLVFGVVLPKTFDEFWRWATQDADCVSGYLAERESSTERAFTILLAGLAGDENDQHHQLIQHSIEELYHDISSEEPVAIDFEAIAYQGRACSMRRSGIPGLKAVSEAHTSGQALLAETGADVVVWGRVLGKERRVELRFTVPAGADRADFDIDQDTLTLATGFSRKMGALIAAKAVAMVKVSNEESGQYLAPFMSKAVAVLEPLVGAPPDGLDARNRGDLFMAYASAKSTIGSQSSSPPDLKAAIAAYQRAIDEFRGGDLSRSRAIAESNMSIAYRNLSLHENFQENLEAAIVASTHAEATLTRESGAWNWAIVKLNRSAAEATLGAFRGGTINLRRAVASADAALTVFTRHMHPHQWAACHLNKGIALGSIGARDGDPKRLQDAADVFRAALQVLDRNTARIDWSKAQVGLGNALRTLSNYRGDVEILQDAAAAFREVLSINDAKQPRNLRLLSMAYLGDVTHRLGRRLNNREMLEDALEIAKRAANNGSPLAETIFRVETLWILAGTQSSLGQLEMGTDLLKQSSQTYSAAADAARSADLELQYGLSILLRALIKREIAERTGDIAILTTASNEIEAVYPVFEDANAVLQFMYPIAKADILRALAELSRESHHIDESLDIFRASIVASSKDIAPEAWAEANLGYGDALMLRARQTKSTADVEDAYVAYSQALTIMKRGDAPITWADLQLRLADVEIAKAEISVSKEHLHAAEAFVSKAMPVFIQVKALHYIHEAEQRRDKISQLMQNN